MIIINANKAIDRVSFDDMLDVTRTLQLQQLHTFINRPIITTFHRYFLHWTWPETHTTIKHLFLGWRRATQSARTVDKSFTAWTERDGPRSDVTAEVGGLKLMDSLQPTCDSTVRRLFTWSQPRLFFLSRSAILQHRQRCPSVRPSVCPYLSACPTQASTMWRKILTGLRGLHQWEAQGL